MAARWSAFSPRRKQALAGHGEARLSPPLRNPYAGARNPVSKLNGQRPYLTLRSNRGVHMVSRSEHVLRVGQDSQDH